MHLKYHLLQNVKTSDRIFFYASEDPVVFRKELISEFEEDSDNYIEISFSNWTAKELCGVLHSMMEMANMDSLDWPELLLQAMLRERISESVQVKIMRRILLSIESQYMGGN